MQNLGATQFVSIGYLLIGSFVLYFSYSIWTLANFLKLSVILSVYVNAPIIIYTIRLANLVMWYVIKSRFKKTNKLDLFEENIHTAIVLPNDIDPNMHMNNARYLTELDYARVSFNMNCGTGAYMFETNNSCYNTICTIRYRKALSPFQKFKIVTKLAYWDEDSFYYEHRFMSRFKDINKFVYCIVYSKMRLLKGTPDEFLQGFLNEDKILEKPSMTEEFKLFIKFNDVSSTNLRKEKQT